VDALGNKRKNKKNKKEKRIVDNYSPLKVKKINDNSDSPSYHTREVRFSTKHPDKGGDWGWQGMCAHTFLKKLLENIHNFSSMKYCDLISPKKITCYFSRQ
jgi:hypothetical protein